MFTADNGSVTVDNIRWSSFIADRLIKLIGWILKTFRSMLFSKMSQDEYITNFSLQMIETNWGRMNYVEQLSDTLSFPFSHSHMLSDNISRIFNAWGWFWTFTRVTVTSCLSQSISAVYSLSHHRWIGPEILYTFYLLNKTYIKYCCCLTASPRVIAMKYYETSFEFREESLKLRV